MRRLSNSVYAEFYFWGCNPGFVVTRVGIVLIDTPQQPIDALRWREMINDRFGSIRYIINTEAHWDHIHGNAYFPGVEVIAHKDIAERYESEILDRVPYLDRLKQTDPDSYWLCQHPSFPLNPPKRIFTDRLEVVLGEHMVVLKTALATRSLRRMCPYPMNGLFSSATTFFINAKHGSRSAIRGSG